MTSEALKLGFHKLIDDFEDEELLTTFYQILSEANTHKQGSLWNSLTDKQKAELEDIVREIDDETNIVKEGDINKKYAKWL
jgi:DNA-binding PadR family transcriptional regulator